VDERRRLPVAWIVGTAFMVFVAIAIVILLLALITALRSRTDGEDAVETPSFTTIEAEAEPTEDLGLVAEPTLTPEPTVITPVAVPTPQVEFVQVGNTGGTGAFIRREARTGSVGIIAHRDGTVLRVIGSDEVANGRVWRNVEDRAGNRGWMPRDYLVPSNQRF
jgi:hypothetical protein